MKKFALFFICILFVQISAQKVQLKRAAIGFLNVENLWDTIPSADYVDGTLQKSNPAFHRSIPVDSIQYLPVTETEYKGEWSDDVLIGKKVVRNQSLSEDFTTKSVKNWGTKFYKQKLANEARVISELGRQYTNSNPAIVGLIEVENRKVVEDLIKEPALAKDDYAVIHYNSYDARGIDVAIIYQKKRFIPITSYKREVKIFNEDGKREYTRDVLVAIGLLDGEKVGVFMNHWPSRRGGEAASQPKRNAAATALREEMDNATTQYPGIKLFAMGDFNDDPVSPSLKKYLEAVSDEKELSEKTPYINLMYKMYKFGVASLGYRDSGNLFDQIIVSKNLLSDEKMSSTYSIFKTEIYAPAYLINKEGQYKGYPFRSWDGDRFTGGYSDHFPAVSIVQRAVQQK